MANIAFTRIQRECKEVVTNKEIQETGIMIEILNENLTEIKVRQIYAFCNRIVF